MIRGVVVRCDVCGRPKKPHGRDAGPGVDSWCTQGECVGYDEPPRAGCLWPNEVVDTRISAVCTAGCEVVADALDKEA